MRLFGARLQPIDLQLLLILIGLSLVVASVIVNFLTDFAVLASTESLGAYSTSLVLPLLLCVAGGCVVALGTHPSGPRTAALALRGAVGLTALGCGVLFTGFQMVALGTCDIGAGSGLVDGCTIPSDVAALSHVIIGVGVATLAVGAGLAALCFIAGRSRDPLRTATG